MRILYLDLDTLRPDHLGCYGYHRATSPNLDRIASEGTIFTNYYCSDAPCLPSRAALMSGQPGIHTGIVNHGGIAADMALEGPDRDFRGQYRRQCLPGFLREAGLRTSLISPFAERHGAYWFYGGFTEMHNTMMGGNESAEHVTPTVLDWIERNAEGDNWYLQVNYWDPHTPYRAPEEFGNPFADEPLPGWITEEKIKQHNEESVGPHSSLEINMYDNREKPELPRSPGEARDMEGFRRMIDGYDCGIAYMDQHIGRVLDALEAKGVLDDLIIIVSSDHGENLGELGVYAEHGTADHITCRIPMIVRWPGKAKGHVNTGLHYNYDLLPTLAGLLEKDRDVAWDGESYAAALDGDRATGREDLVVGQCAHVVQRGVRFGPWMYIRTLHDGFHLYPDEMLFNIEEDPHEEENLAEARPDVCHEAAARLMNWHDRMMKTMPGGRTVDPLWTVIHEGGPCYAKDRLAPYCDRLTETGRGWAVPELKRKHPREFKD
jgi:choline-sulfatase